MRILVSGSTGMIGTALITLLTTRGHIVIRLIRPQTTLALSANGDHTNITWDPKSSLLDGQALEGFDAVIHLAGENIASGLWTETKKREMLESRVLSTELLSEALAKLTLKPKVFICASAIGYYGNRGNETIREDSRSGDGFLAELCSQWETACEPARQTGIRVINLRLGVVLSPRGGALGKMLLPFEMGVGGQIGSGNQYFSWITVDDVAGVILHALHTESLSGAVNVVAPNPVKNKDFTKALGKVLSRPTLLPIPSFVLKILFGEMADECLIAGQKVEPAKLLASGYKFRDSQIETALRRILGK